MIKEIWWKPGEITNFTGRNGYFKCAGIELFTLEHTDQLMISPFTSQGRIGRCDIAIPKSAMPELISQLELLLGGNNS